MQKKWKKLFAAFMIAAIVLMSFMPYGVQAAINAKPAGITKKTLKFDKTKVSLNVGKSCQIKIKNTSGIKVKSTKWTATKGKDIVKLSQKSKQSVTVKAKKQGIATVQAKIKTASGTVTRTVKITVNQNHQLSWWFAYAL